MFSELQKELDEVYRKLGKDRGYIKVLHSVERSLSKLGIKYGSDGHDLFLPSVTAGMGLLDPYLSVYLRVRPQAIELAALIAEEPEEDLTSELYWYWYKHPNEAVYFGIMPTENGKEGLAVFSRLPVSNPVLLKPRVLAPLINSAITHMHSACKKLQAGEYTGPGSAKTQV